MPIWSALERSIPRASYSLPRRMLPAPITIASCTPRAATSLISRAKAASESRSMPAPWAGASAWPESLSITRWKRGLCAAPPAASVIAFVSSGARAARLGAGGRVAVARFAELETDEAADFDLFAQLGYVFAQQIGDRAIGIAHPGLLVETDVAIELFQLAVDDFLDHRLSLAR